MNRKTLFLLLGVLTLGFAANAQTTDTTHIMHHRFHRAPGDSAFHRFHGAPDGNGYTFHRPASPGAFHRPGGLPGREGYAFHRGHREFVHYTPDQRKQVMAINKDYRQKAADLFKQDNITLKQYKAGLITLQKEKKTKLEGLLTPLQKDEVALRRKRRTDDAQLKADSRLERLKQSLSLTDDQVAKLKTGQDNLRTQAEAIRANDNLLPQEKHEQMKTLMTTRNDNFKTILTPDQYTKFQQMMSHRRGGPGGPGGPGSPGGGPWQGRGGFGGRTT
jgi:hypothetical protein